MTSAVDLMEKVLSTAIQHMNTKASRAQSLQLDKPNIMISMMGESYMQASHEDKEVESEDKDSGDEDDVAVVSS